MAKIPPILCMKLMNLAFRQVERNNVTLKTFAEVQNEHRLQNTGKRWTIPDRDLDLLASIDLLSRDPKNRQFTLNVL